jgi:hypothetical protein
MNSLISQAVEQVSRWALKRATPHNGFVIWTLHYPDAKPAVFPSLHRQFAADAQSAGLSPERMIAREALGRSMFYDQTYGSCTSVSIYLSTILRAIGIPTRTIVCIPPFDPNDKSQADAFYAAVDDERVRLAVAKGLNRAEGFIDHIFNEVYIGGRWVRLNYGKLGQPILEPAQLGLMVRVAAFDSISEAPLAATWGMRYFYYPIGQPRLSSINPYKMLSIRDSRGAGDRLP